MLLPFDPECYKLPGSPFPNKSALAGAFHVMRESTFRTIKNLTEKECAGGPFTAHLMLVC